MTHHTEAGAPACMPPSPPTTPPHLMGLGVGSAAVASSPRRPSRQMPANSSDGGAAPEELSGTVGRAPVRLVLQDSREDSPMRLPALGVEAPDLLSCSPHASSAPQVFIASHQLPAPSPTRSSATGALGSCLSMSTSSAGSPARAAKAIAAANKAAAAAAAAAAERCSGSGTEPQPTTGEGEGGYYAPRTPPSAQPPADVQHQNLQPQPPTHLLHSLPLISPTGARPATSHLGGRPLTEMSGSGGGSGEGAGAGGSGSVPVQAGASRSLFALNPHLPPGMSRQKWSLDDYTITKKLQKGYASTVYQVRACSSRAWSMNCEQVAMLNAGLQGKCASEVHGCFSASPTSPATRTVWCCSGDLQPQRGDGGAQGLLHGGAARPEPAPGEDAPGGEGGVNSNEQQQRVHSNCQAAP